MYVIRIRLGLLQWHFTHCFSENTKQNSIFPTLQNTSLSIYVLRMREQRHLLSKFPLSARASAFNLHNKLSFTLHTLLLKLLCIKPNYPYSHKYNDVISKVRVVTNLQHTYQNIRGKERAVSFYIKFIWCFWLLVCKIYSFAILSKSRHSSVARTQNLLFLLRHATHPWWS